MLATTIARGLLSVCGWLLVLPGSSPTAQGQVWIVDDDGAEADFAVVQDAVDAASDFDTIVVRAGSYPAFSVGDEALTIVGEEGAVVSSLAFFEPAPPPFVALGLSAGKTLVVRGLTFSATVLVANGLDELTEGAVVGGCDGAVLFEDCTLRSSSGDGLRVFGSANVVLHRTTVDAGGSYYYSFNGEYWDQPGLYSTDSDVYLFDSTVLGSFGPDAQELLFEDLPAGPGGDGARIDGGSLTCQGSTITGGQGGSGVPAVCVPGMDGGLGLVHAGGAAIRLLDSEASGGKRGVSGAGCSEPNGAPGDDFAGDPGQVTAYGGVARSFAWESPVVGGQDFGASFGGQPGDFAFLIVGPWLGDDQHFGALGITLLAGPSYTIVPLGVLPPLAVDFTAPHLGGAAAYLQLAAQVAWFESDGTAFLSGPSVLSVLDEMRF